MRWVVPSGRRDDRERRDDEEEGEKKGSVCVECERIGKER
jgi:hypothetical protein